MERKGKRKKGRGVRKEGKKKKLKKKKKNNKKKKKKLKKKKKNNKKKKKKKKKGKKKKKKKKKERKREIGRKGRKGGKKEKNKEGKKKEGSEMGRGWVNNGRRGLFGGGSFRLLRSVCRRFIFRGGRLALRAGRLFDRQQHSARLHRIARLDMDLGDFSRVRAGQLENRFVGLDFHHDLIGRDRVADGHAQAADLRFVDIFSDGRKFELNAHDVLYL